MGRLSLLPVFFLAFVCLCAPAWADQLAIDTNGEDLSIGASQATAMYLRSDQNVVVSNENVTPTAKMQIAGGIRIGQDPHHSDAAPTGSCASSLAGTLSFLSSTGRLYICNGSHWTKVSLIN